MWYQWLADVVVLFHLTFIFFVVAGGLLALKWPRIAWLHLPTVAWGTAVECTGWICPLTPLEVWLRVQGGDSGYRTDFIEQYVLPALYPENLTREVQIVLGLFVVTVNVLVYSWLWRRSFTRPAHASNAGLRK
jgi:hypothetical protein